MEGKLSEASRRATPSPIQQLSHLAQRVGAVNLAEGFPDFPAPAHVKAAAVGAIAADLNQYRSVSLPRRTRWVSSELQMLPQADGSTASNFIHQAYTELLLTRILVGWFKACAGDLRRARGDDETGPRPPRRPSHRLRHLLRPIRGLRRGYIRK
jgi:hypothetical protein